MVGYIGLDTEPAGLYTREVWTKEKSSDLDMIDSPLPWYPEQCGCRACEVVKFQNNAC